MSYSEDLRERVIAYRQAGHALRETSQTYKVAVDTIRSWEKLQRETGSLAKRTPKRSFKKIDPALLRKHIEQYPDAYLHEIAKVFACTAEAIRQACKREGITLKKRQSTIESKTLQR